MHRHRIKTGGLRKLAQDFLKQLSGHIERSPEEWRRWLEQYRQKGYAHYDAWVTIFERISGNSESQQIPN